MKYVGVGRVGGSGWSMWVWEVRRLGGVCVYVCVGGVCGVGVFGCVWSTCICVCVWVGIICEWCVCEGVPENRCQLA